MSLLTERHTSMADLSAPVESSQPAVSWAAIFCGAVVAASVSLILVLLGSALDLAAISPWAGRGASVTAFTAMAAIWFIVTQWVASSFGGYLTGRLRTKWVSIHTHEVFFRDTAHGFVTWALATLLTAGLLASAAFSLASSGAHALAATASDAAQGETANSAMGSYDLDVLFRGTRADANPTTPEPRAEVAHIIAKGLTQNGVSAADRSYLASLVVARTGISQTDAERRVDTLIARSKETADHTRKTSIEAAFYTALSMLIGAFIACAAAALGGRRRDAAAPSTH